MMRKVLVLVMLLALPALRAVAQEVRVVDGRKYIVHTVEQGQTLFAISRHYAVSVEDLQRANPGAAQGIAIGQVLLVPQEGVAKKELKSAPALKRGELVHTVTKKETLFGISRKYGLDVNDLLQRNPEASQGLREGMELVIPVAKVEGARPEVTAPASAATEKQHLVKPGETIYSLSKDHGVEPDALKAANGGLAEGLKAGYYITIPQPAPVAVPVDTVDRRRRYQIAFLLPFSLDRNDSLLAADPQARMPLEVTEIAAQFYGGARLALDSLSDRGLRADVLVRDVGTDAKVWGPVLRDAELRRSDIFIGPFHRGAIEELARAVHGSLIVCPVPQTNKIILGRPDVCKVISARADQVQTLARHAARTHARDNLLLVRPDIFSDKEVQDQMSEALQAAYAGMPGRSADSLRTVAPGRRDITAVINALDAARMNALVVPSEDVEFVTTLVTKLALLTEKYRITVYGLSAWLDWESLDPADLDRLNTHVPRSTFVDRSDPRVIAFAQRFRDRFAADAGPYAYLGYDVTMHFLTGLMDLGGKLPDRLDRVSTQPLHMGFQLQRTGPENGFRNTSSVVVRLAGLELQRAR
ncbi:MAG: LysM peptidoglycan-binding domain-containing protein [Flavobacteriales bacterium]|nr:LysM peptidoglycan-binding domain-containing protein [Flavobacteriales bacterium]